MGDIIYNLIIPFYITIVCVSVAYTVIWRGLGKHDKGGMYKWKDNKGRYNPYKKEDAIERTPHTFLLKGAYVLANFMVLFLIYPFAELRDRAESIWYLKYSYYAGWFLLVCFAFSLRNFFEEINILLVIIKNKRYRSELMEYPPRKWLAIFATICIIVVVIYFEVGYCLENDLFGPFIQCKGLNMILDLFF